MLGLTVNPVKRAIRHYLWQWFKRQCRAELKRERSRMKRGKYGLIRAIFRVCALGVALGATESGAKGHLFLAHDAPDGPSKVAGGASVVGTR